MKLKLLSFPIIIICFFSFCTKENTMLAPPTIDPTIERISGITMVAPPSVFEANPIPPIADVNAKWISIVPYGFSPNGKPDVYYNAFGQWWGETPAGIRESAKLAHAGGLKVMLKPQVYIPNGWVGEMDFDNESDWITWEESYETYIMTMVDLAIELDIELLCIGTEYKLAVHKREAFWRSLIQKIRLTYDGKILYSSNWDAYQDIPIWDVLDYIGVSAYFPLSESLTPSVDELSQAWKPIIKDMKKLSKNHDKPVLFTEYGYLTIDKCAYRAWELEKNIKTKPINQQAQANAYEALYKNMLEQDYWMGGFLWKWFPNDKGAEGYIPRDYTPQGKLSEDIVRRYHAQF